MKLSEYQMEFLLSLFLTEDIKRNYPVNYPGWKNIAEKLLVDGSCIVPGDKCIWIGGIGNFIRINHTDKAVGCVEYVFNIQSFLRSEFFKEIYALEEEKLTNHKNLIEGYLKELKKLK